MLNNLRQLIQARNLDAYLIPSADAHQSEYIAECDARRQFISNFTGSAGTALVTMNMACLWTDGRYFLQASKELSKEWTLMKQPDCVSIVEFLKQNNLKCGVDARLVSIAEKCPNFSSCDNLLDLLWKDKPKRPNNPIFVHEEKYSGSSTKRNIELVCEYLEVESKKQNIECSGLLLTALDDICHLLNLRGSDIPFNPVFFSFAFVDLKQRKCILFSQAKVEGLETLPYESVYEFCEKIQNYVFIDSKCNWEIEQRLKFKRIEPLNIVSKLKSIKNPIQLQGFRNCHLRDGAALCNFFSWLRTAKVTEFEASNKLLEFRKQQKLFVQPSFDTISAFGPNGAIIHYKPKVDSLEIKEGMYLCDSGGQYLDGTTDVTRTLCSNPTNEQKRAYTRVLQGHIAIDQLRFPKETTGFMIDAIARVNLWKDGLDFKHGVGHGVGHFLNVHEGPQAIAQRIGANVPLKEGMTITNEPGYYKPNEFGIRIENVCLVVEKDGFLEFENVTFVPLESSLIDISLLGDEELQWINNYHLNCFEKISPLVSLETLEWLKEKTQLIKTMN